MVGTLRADKVVVFIGKERKRWSTSCHSVFRFTRSLQNPCLCVFMVIVFESIDSEQDQPLSVYIPPPLPPPPSSTDVM